MTEHAEFLKNNPFTGILFQTDINEEKVSIETAALYTSNLAIAFELARIVERLDKIIEEGLNTNVQGHIANY